MIKEDIRAFAKEIGIEKVGFTQNGVVALFPYFVENEEGNISMYARGLDYHNVCEEKLRRIADELLRLGAGFAEIHVDKGKLDDRRAAFEAGLGFYGQNGMLICEEYGSYFFIGQVIHDLETEPDKPLERDCLQCGRCERACPGKALYGGRVDVERCLSEITQKRGELSAEEERLIKSRGFCWGCDVCQRVCPHNQGLKTTAIPEFLEERITELKKAQIEGLSNREFKERFGRFAFSWRGKGVLLRNLSILEEEDE